MSAPGQGSDQDWLPAQSWIGFFECKLFVRLAPLLLKEECLLQKVERFWSPWKILGKFDWGRLGEIMVLNHFWLTVTAQPTSLASASLGSLQEAGVVVRWGCVTSTPVLGTLAVVSPLQPGPGRRGLASCWCRPGHNCGGPPQPSSSQHHNQSSQGYLF